MTARPNGFSLVELTVAIVVSGILLLIITNVMQSVTGTGMELNLRTEKIKRQVVLRRLFHRDIQNMTEADSFKFTGTSISFETTHSTLLHGPLPVQVTWTFEGNNIKRAEVLNEIGYAGGTILTNGLGVWSIKAQSTSHGLVDLKSLVAAGRNLELSQTLTALFLEMELDKEQVKFVERIPYAVLLQQDDLL